MKLRLILLCALALLFPRAADPVGEGPWEKLWGTNVRVTNLPSLEACMESDITTSCILGRGVYDQGATTLDIAVDTTLGSKALVCELGTQITGTIWQHDRRRRTGVRARGIWDEISSRCTRLRVR